MALTDIASMDLIDRSPTALGRSNRRAVLNAISQAGFPVSRSDLVTRTGLNAASVSRITKGLIDAGIIRETAATESPGKPGRRFIGLEMHPDGGFVLGIAINAYQQSISLANIRNEPIDGRLLEMPDVSHSDQVITRLIEAATSLLRKHRVPSSRLLGIGVAISGLIDTLQGVVLDSPVLAWRDVAIGPRLHAAIGATTVVENLPQVVHVAEHRFGQAMNMQTTLLVNAALGIGSSLYVDNRLHARPAASGIMIGQVKVPVGGASDKMRSLDLVAAGRGVLIAAGAPPREVERMPPAQAAQRLADLIDEATSGKCSLQQPFIDAGRALGAFCAAAAAAVHPQALILAGPMSVVPCFCEAWQTRLMECTSDRDLLPLVSTLGYRDAAQWLAIEHGLLADDIGAGMRFPREAA